MFTEKQLQKIPDEIERLFREMELDLLIDIIDRVKRFDEISRTADYELWVVTQMRQYDTDYRKIIQIVLNKTDDEMLSMFAEVLSEGYATDKELYQAAGIEYVPYEKNDALQQFVKSMVDQCQGDLKNITGTIGFVLDNNGRYSETLSDYYKHLMNRAVVETASGAFNYDQTIKRITTEMARSGIRTIDYESGHHDRVDVAVRRAVMTGLNQSVQWIANDNAEKLDTEYFEVSAHVTARPSHAIWQGKVYTKEQLVSVCGLGTGPGLMGWNCYHHYDPFIPGVSVRKYSDKELSDLYQKTQEKHSYKGKEYTMYDATQHQRYLERRMRVQDEKIAMMKESGGSKDELRALKSRRTATYQEYKDFSDQMGLQEQMNRVFNSENVR